jgi:hypothetical protein
MLSFDWSQITPLAWIGLAIVGVGVLIIVATICKAIASINRGEYDFRISLAGFIVGLLAGSLGFAIFCYQYPPCGLLGQ